MREVPSCVIDTKAAYTTGTGVRLAAVLAGAMIAAAGCGGGAPARNTDTGAAGASAAGATAAPETGVSAAAGASSDAEGGSATDAQGGSATDAGGGSATDAGGGTASGSDDGTVDGLPPGKTCAEVARAIARATGIAWVKPAGVGDETQPGERRCEAQAPGATLRVVLYRPDWPADTPEKFLTDAKARSGGCSTEMAAPLDGVGYATSCVDPSGSVTTLVIEAGWVVVSVTAPDETVTFTQKASRKGAVSALSLL
ncbi:hypothetical protein [Actinoplanes sp. NPDC051494]|uniref:hypothetical protein n=1 Tax=Actinoplanes sp. NPDC051494 TaxID=3363907 RepID=UPI0037B8FE0E